MSSRNQEDILFLRDYTLRIDGVDGHITQVSLFPPIDLISS